jgi:preprotein translocase subunit YajC
MVIVVIGGMYLFLIRPQQRRARETQQMQSSLGVGDEIMTGSGLYGTVTEMDDEEGLIALEIAPGIVVKFARGAVSRVVTPFPQETSSPHEVDDGVAEDDSPTEPVDEADHATDSSSADQVIERRD